MSSSRYSCLNSEGVRAAMSVVGANTPGEIEKRNMAMAKVVIDSVGIEPEKYRLGYTKV